MSWQLNVKVIEQFDRVIAAGYPILCVETWEEERLEKILYQLNTKEINRPVWVWSAAEGFSDGPGADEDLREPHQALEFIKQHGHSALCLMRDLPGVLADAPRLRRLLRDVYDELEGKAGAVIMSHPEALLPSDVNKEVYLIELPLPDRMELESYLEMLNSNEPESGRFSADWLENCAAEMKGLTTNECGLLFRRLVAAQASDQTAVRSIIRQQRARVLMKESCLEVVDTDLDLDSLGGLANLKRWIVSRQQLYGLEAQRAGISPPSGMLMMGVSGCGKSLAAKVIAAAWNLPLIRLDMNLIMSGAWGSPEIAWSRALGSIVSIAPVVVWIDEIENSFGYVDGQSTSGNLTIFSSFLTWMQEKTRDVFVVATANNIDLLPAEMLRKGRFDELFFLDLPNQKAREEILGIHIAMQGEDPSTFDLVQLAELLDGWTASEIEQLVRAARVEAFCDRRSFGINDLKNTSFNMVPLSKTMSEQINDLRRWARSRAVSAD